MPIVGLDIGVGHRFTGCHQCVTDLDGPLRREAPVGAERGHQKLCLCTREHCCQAAVLDSRSGQRDLARGSSARRCWHQTAWKNGFPGVANSSLPETPTRHSHLARTRLRAVPCQNGHSFRRLTCRSGAPPSSRARRRGQARCPLTDKRPRTSPGRTESHGGQSH